MNFFLTFLFAVLFAPAFSQSSKDSIAIVNLLIDDYKTMTNNDYKKHKANCTTDYLLIEKGEIMTLAKEEHLYNQIAQMKLQRSDKFEFRKITIVNNFAYAVYNLKSHFKNSTNEFNREWNESAVFKKIKGKWKIALIHSTLIEEPK